MKVEHTHHSPILLKLIPEGFAEAFKLGEMAKAFKNMKILYNVRENGMLVLNIDPCGWKDFTEYEELKDGEFIAVCIRDFYMKADPTCRVFTKDKEYKFTTEHNEGPNLFAAIDDCNELHFMEQEDITLHFRKE